MVNIDIIDEIIEIFDSYCNCKALKKNYLLRYDLEKLLTERLKETENAAYAEGYANGKCERDEYYN